ncbi:hypothetical protein F5Y15DRAFT_410674 [Xylariaceae sp. FL0016]|nr:hypothetical protein F5Y15DRAFT_410674 [Xylariaceae sp. FL0016]
MADSSSAPGDGSGDGDGDSRKPVKRPSFSGFWKKSKEKSVGRNLTFVSSHPQKASASSKDGTQGETAETKAQARRAQVRKAQIQHRQRKVNYTKELEMDIVRLREMIEKTEQESVRLRDENDSFRSCLTHSSIDASMMTGLPAQATLTTSFSVPPAPEYTVSLEMSDLMETPAFRVTRSPSAYSSGAVSGISSGQASAQALTITGGSLSPATAAAGGSADTAMTTGIPLSTLSDIQTDQAINFILALEHICWDHFDSSYFAHADFDPAATENGHALMASSIALQSAPTEVFGRLNNLQERLRADPHAHPHRHSAQLPTPASADAITWQLRAGGNGGPGLTLESLYGLASTLNRPDRELAPVQAWFEIARLYGLGVAVDASSMQAVQGQLAGVVKCLHFGAVIERDAFDSVLGRVLGPPVIGEEADLNSGSSYPPTSTNGRVESSLESGKFGQTMGRIFRHQ